MRITCREKVNVIECAVRSGDPKIQCKIYLGSRFFRYGGFMFERLLLVVILIFSVFTFAVAVQVPAVSETDIYRPDKSDIISWMNHAAAMTTSQQAEKVDAAIKNISLSGGKTPRSDFQICMGLAYLGNAYAQRCVANAYENGIGIIDDTLEAYVWFELAHGSGDAESGADVARVIIILNSVYPAPTEEELELLVTEQKIKIAEYLKEIKLLVLAP